MSNLLELADPSEARRALRAFYELNEIRGFNKVEQAVLADLQAGKLQAEEIFAIMKEWASFESQSQNQIPRINGPQT